MQEKSLLKLAVICTLAGLSILFILSQEISVDESMLSKITNTDSSVMIKGSVVRITNSTNSRIVQLEKKETISIILPGHDYLDLTKGDNVEAIGNWLENSKDKLSMTANELRKI